MPVFKSDVTVPNLTINEAKNIAVGATTGTKIGTATTQKLAFFNSTPIVQPAATDDLITGLINLGLRAVGTAVPITTAADVSFGTVTAVGVRAAALVSQSMTLSASYTIPTNHIAYVFGIPYQILSGVILTISSGSLFRLDD